jgi:hypothetical protein
MVHRVILSKKVIQVVPQSLQTPHEHDAARRQDSPYLAALSRVGSAFSHHQTPLWLIKSQPLSDKIALFTRHESDQRVTNKFTYHIVG